MLAAGVALVVPALAGCSETPSYTFKFTNNCAFPIDVAVIIKSQGLTAKAIEIWPTEQRKYVVFSSQPNETAHVIVNASDRTPNDSNERTFPLAVGDVEHAPDPSKPLESVIDGELCEGLH